MSSNYVCDYCGEPIESLRDCVSLHAIGYDQLGDYHADTCVGFIRQAIEAACETRRVRPSRGDLAGPIADLERTFHETGGEAP